MSRLNIAPEFRRKFNKQPCPICESIEGCDHTMQERLRAAEDEEYRDRMRAADPLWQIQQSRKGMAARQNALLQFLLDKRDECIADHPEWVKRIELMIRDYAADEPRDAQLASTTKVVLSAQHKDRSR